MAVKKKTTQKRTTRAKTTEIPSSEHVESLNKIGFPNFNYLMGNVKSSFNQISPIYIILIFALLAALTYFIFFSKDQYKKENKELKSQIESIQNERNSIKDSLSILQNQYSKLEDSATIKQEMIENISNKIILIEQKISSSYTQLNQLQTGMNSINQEIKKVNQEPSKKTGDDLIKSLKSKLN
jgi:septal ring factor EnvC (AmiA/AmiB activator)